MLIAWKFINHANTGRVPFERLARERVYCVDNHIIPKPENKVALALPNL
jgi:hypothetical protein